MLSVKLRSFKEPIDKALRILKKKMDVEGIFKEVRKRRYNKKPSEKAREKSQAAGKRRR